MTMKPERIQDRRKRALSRGTDADRRRFFRYKVDFPVRVTVGQGKDQQVFEGTAADLSEGGLRLEHVVLPEGTREVKLRFAVPEGKLPEGFDRHEFQLEGEVRRADPGEAVVQVAFEETLGQHLARRSWAFLKVLAVFVGFISVSLIVLIKHDNWYYFWFDAPVFLYSLAVGIYLLCRFVFAGMYRAPRETGATPEVSVIIPAHNEEVHIRRTIRDIYESRYPADKLQVVVVNDGSTDGTQKEIEASQQEYPELIALEFKKSVGKRHALAAGTRMTDSEIVVYVDSDSFLDPDGLARIVEGFSDKRVAAVTGHCDVENTLENMLTKMQAVRYFLGFRIMKAAESLFDSVTCLSGPFAAYRRSVLIPRMEEWLGQQFMGQPATFGDDRSMTNALLRDGFAVLYDSRARCTTIVPETYRGFLRQQMRWKRSWFRESLRACTFIWRRQPFMWLSFYAGFLLPLLGPAVVFRALLYIPLFQQGTPLVYLTGILLMSMLMSASYLLVRKSRLWIYGVHFCFFYLLVLIWQLPWAVCTFWSPDWGTRKGRI